MQRLMRVVYVLIIMHRTTERRTRRSHAAHSDETLADVVWGVRVCQVYVLAC